MLYFLLFRLWETLGSTTIVLCEFELFINERSSGFKTRTPASNEPLPRSYLPQRNLRNLNLLGDHCVAGLAY